ncbi:hypothetical protein [Sphingomonas sp. NFX23]|uniref:hypothetical protein n=1 Tax=Sphingomonas sp. NFX23 TaxID=2819532 RepID=UPI003CFAFA01
MTLFNRTGEANKTRSRDLRVWTPTGQLRDDVTRVIGQRLLAGDDRDAIIRDINISKSVGRRKCAEIARALGIPSRAELHEQFCVRVCELADTGMTDREIADSLHRSIEAVANARRRRQGAKYTVIRLTPEEHAKIDRMILEGFNQYEIAEAVGCDQGLVSTRAQRLDHSKIKHVRPPCECGKRAGHGGRCYMVVVPGLIRQRLLDGRTTTDIARELGRTASGFKRRYAQPVIDELTAEGHRCGCGQQFGHQFVCSVTMAVQRRTFTEAQRQTGEHLVRQGASVETVRRAMFLSVGSAQALVRDLRSTLAAKGALCPCGEPLDHSLTCATRNGITNGRTGFRFTSATAAKMTPLRRRLIAKYARAGHGCKAICDKTGESEWRVDILVAELLAAGATPAECVSCDRPYNHKGPCPLPVNCSCGRKRKHRGACRQAGPKLTVSNGGKPPAVAPDLYKAASVRYRDGASIQEISDRVGIPRGQAQRLVAYWRKRSIYTPKPCICGRPARHTGGCEKNTPGAAGKLARARIDRDIRDGQMPHRIAQRLGLHVQTVLKHSMMLRDRLHAEGTSCACGRPIGHPYWCSAKWDGYEMPRGARPLPDDIARIVAARLVVGDVVSEIAAAVKIGTDRVWAARLELPEEDRQRRTFAVRARISRGKALQRQDIMGMIEAAVPQRIDAMLRDDVVGEIFLAVIEGRIEVEQIKAAVRSFVAKGIAQWQSAYGPRSLDQKLFADGSRTLGDMLEDETTTAQIDQLELGDRT